MKVIFLDRDGVINKDPGFGDYIKSWVEFQFLPGSIEAIKRLNEKGYVIFVISNQAGVGRGLFSNSRDAISSTINRARGAPAGVTLRSNKGFGGGGFGGGKGFSMGATDMSGMTGTQVKRAMETGQLSQTGTRIARPEEMLTNPGFRR